MSEVVNAAGGARLNRRPCVRELRWEAFRRKILALRGKVGTQENGDLINWGQVRVKVVSRRRDFDALSCTACGLVGGNREGGKFHGFIQEREEEGGT